ncbi:MAG TPA: hypothetical protein VFR81_25300 [Longimicrobium sp.]|nr:hypothetical protein [Longimicrobium sp.]
MECVYKFAGGRKMFAQYLAVALLTGMALWMRPSFWEYALGVCAALGIAVGGVALEDSSRHAAAARAAHPDAGEASPGYHRPGDWSPEPQPEVDEP